MSKTTINRSLKDVIKQVPNSNRVTQGLSKYFSGYLMVDAKYIRVKGREKMAFIWALDYYKHDILFSGLYPKESYEAYYDCFEFIRRIGYNMKAVISDEHPSILTTKNYIFPKTRHQICHTHYLRNIRKALNLKGSNPEHNTFLKDCKRLLSSKLIYQYSRRAKDMFSNYGGDKLLRSILLDMNSKHDYLVACLFDKKCPRTTNLIEGYNSHLAQRLASIKGFESYESASMWLNAYVVKRRVTEFTDCEGRFKRLNGESPLWQTTQDYGPVKKLKKHFGNIYYGV